MTTHRLDPTPGTVLGRFNRELPPVLTVDPGDTVVYRTIDASWGHLGKKWFGIAQPDVGQDLELDRGHAMTGPVAIRGARAGDVLEVKIDDLQPGDWGWTWAGPMKHRDRDYLHLDEETGLAWKLDAPAGMWRDSENRGIGIPVRPFMGVMGNSPAEFGDLSTAPPRRVGGNLDCKELVSGSTLWLPIEVDGALFSVGDGHGAQGDGEVSGTAVECPMERVVLTFQIRRDLRIDAPKARTPAGVVTLGLGDTVDDAGEMALAAMLDHLIENYELSRPEAAIVASLAVDLRVTQIVNGTVGAHALLPPGGLEIESRS